MTGEAYPGFCSMKQLGILLLFLDGMLVHRREPPSISSGFSDSLLVHIYTPRLWSERRHCECKVSCPRTQPNDPARARTRTSRSESSELTTRPPRLPHERGMINNDNDNDSDNDSENDNNNNNGYDNDNGKII